jgi:hypothetical protein
VRIWENVGAIDGLALFALHNRSLRIVALWFYWT